VVALLPATGAAADAGGRHYDDVGSETASEVAVQNRAHAVSRTSQLRKSSSTVSQSFQVHSGHMGSCEIPGHRYEIRSLLWATTLEWRRDDEGHRERNHQGLENRLIDGRATGRRDGGIYGVRIEASDAFQSEKM
jgi:hypothetical protein